MKRFILILALSVFSFEILTAQTDSLVFRNGTYIVGEVKKMERSVVTVETPYSDKDFNIKWHRVMEIYTSTYFLVSLSDGSRYNGTLESKAPGRVSILSDEGDTVDVNIIDIVFLDDRDLGFWSQLYFSIDVGLNLTKANNFKQFSTNSTIGYAAKRWNLDAAHNILFSHQDNTDDIQRQDGRISYRYFLPHDWYPLISADFLSNTEQLLNLRSTWKLGMGKFIVHTNKSYWGFSAGANYNNENFSGDVNPDRRSWEGFIGSEYNMFNMGDLDLLTNIVTYPSFTESGRWRIDYKIDTKYEMWFDDDFYIKLSFTLNYDNRPAEGATTTDYVFQTGFGWEW